MITRACLWLCFAVVVGGCAPQRPPPATVASVDLARYAGTWYEIERFDHWFERDLVAVTATYTIRPDGQIDVVNQGHRHQVTGDLKTATARAWVAAPAKLKVRFFWPFAGDYWILGLSPDYRWAVVGAPKRDYLWLLHREAQPSADDRAAMREIALSAGYDLSLLRPVDQPSRRAK